MKGMEKIMADNGRANRHGERTWRVDAVEITEHPLDENHPEWDILGRLRAIVPVPIQEADLEGIFRRIMAFAHMLGTRYENPRYSVIAPKPSPAFFRQVRIAQQRWLRFLKQAVFLKSRRMKTELRRMSGVERALQVTGVLVVAGKHVIGSWKRFSREQPRKHDLVGQRFGRLVVVSQLSGGRCRCKCNCRRWHVAFTRHLRAGRTKSCGCAWADKEKRRRGPHR
jgi:hypothetical protein